LHDRERWEANLRDVGMTVTADDGLRLGDPGHPSVLAQAAERT